MVYKPTGVCSQAIDIELDGDIIESVSFVGGCHGNLQGIAALVIGIGMAVDSAVITYSRIKEELNSDIKETK